MVLFTNGLQFQHLLFDKAPYKNVIVLGHVQDKDGQKMSKSKGNAVDPFEALEDSTVQMPSDGISILTQCTMASKPFPWIKQFRKDSVNLWEHSGTHMHSMFYMLNIDQFDPTKYTLRL